MAYWFERAKQEDISGYSFADPYLTSDEFVGEKVFEDPDNYVEPPLREELGKLLNRACTLTANAVEASVYEVGNSYSPVWCGDVDETAPSVKKVTDLWMDANYAWEDYTWLSKKIERLAAREALEALEKAD